ncbi:hypothetical protein [Aquisphaera giovannonii]|uniref:hypothetical protein n=1 Tax=Aquisphaera giovannonii TaxID=406548 RepID=UPI0011DF2D12|nr:hypothetical protein [Aquisphaera giovannonii]
MEKQAGEARLAEAHAESKPAMTQDDFRVFDAVLADLLDSEVFQTFSGANGGQTEIVLHQRSAGGPIALSERNLLAESRDEPSHTIPVDLRDDLRKRNPGSEISLDEFKPSDPRIVIRDLAESYSYFDFSNRFPHGIGYVIAWLPGYSTNGRTAVFRASFGPTSHGATLTYLLTRKDGRWTVSWRTTISYL